MKFFEIKHQPTLKAQKTASAKGTWKSTRFHSSTTREM